MRRRPDDGGRTVEGPCQAGHVQAEMHQVVETTLGPLALTVPAVIVGYRVPAALSQGLRGASPGVTGLATAMREDDRRVLRITPGFGSEVDAVLAGEFEAFGLHAGGETAAAACSFRYAR